MGLKIHKYVQGQTHRSDTQQEKIRAPRLYHNRRSALFQDLSQCDFEKNGYMRGDHTSVIEKDRIGYRGN